MSDERAGRQITRRLPLGVAAQDSSFTETKVYDKTANLTVDVDGDGTNDSDPGYGQLLHEIDFEGRVTQYLYDNSASGRGRLVARRYFESTSAFDGGAGTPERVISYRYDAFGRQVEVSDNAFIEATTQDTIPSTYAYDADGRLVTIDSPQGTLHYAYDDLASNRLRKIIAAVSTHSLPSGWTAGTGRSDYNAREMPLHLDLERVTSGWEAVGLGR